MQQVNPQGIDGTDRDGVRPDGSQRQDREEDGKLKKRWFHTFVSFTRFQGDGK